MVMCMAMYIRIAMRMTMRMCSNDGWVMMTQRRHSSQIPVRCTSDSRALLPSSFWASRHSLFVLALRCYSVAPFVLLFLLPGVLCPLPGVLLFPVLSPAFCSSALLASTFVFVSSSFSAFSSQIIVLRACSSVWVVRLWRIKLSAREPGARLFSSVFQVEFTTGGSFGRRADWQCFAGTQLRPYFQVWVAPIHLPRCWCGFNLPMLMLWVQMLGWEF